VTFNVSDIVGDPDLAESFTIFRILGSFVSGVWTANAPMQIPARGVVGVATDLDLQMVPEGDRVTGSMVFYTQTPIQVTSETGSNVSDQIQWNGAMYRIQAIGPWVSFGFYKAIGVRMQGS
jgi:hypothetical protein